MLKLIEYVFPLDGKTNYNETTTRNRIRTFGDGFYHDMMLYNAFIVYTNSIRKSYYTF